MKMALFIEILEGSDTGSRFLIKEGLKIGRSNADILVRDNKVSSLHARFEKDKKGQLILVDNDSVNGLRINGQKVSRIAMMPGVKFQLGKTYLIVVELFGDHEEIVERSREKDLSGWKSLLKEHFSHVRAINSPPNPDLKPFHQPVFIKFIAGIQMDEVVALGYGPRQFGADVLDIELYEPQSPSLCFELFPEDSAIRFVSHDDRILLNDRIVSSELLSEGDVIRIGQTLMQVSFSK